MKQFADTFKDADAVLEELLSFQEVAMVMREATLPYGETDGSIALNRYMVETAITLKKNVVRDFRIAYPAISTLIGNGSAATSKSTGRLHNACFLFGSVQKSLKSKNFVLKTESDREAISSDLAQVITDLSVYILVQYQFNMMDQELISMSIAKHCDHCGITPDIFYGLQIQTLDDVGGYWYAYEPISPLYEEMMELDPTFMSDCEEVMFPLSDAMAVQLLEGKVSMSKARQKLNEFKNTGKEEEVDVSTHTLVDRMKLE